MTAFVYVCVCSHVADWPAAVLNPPTPLFFLHATPLTCPHPCPCPRPAQVYNENETPFATANLANPSINETELFRKVGPLGPCPALLSTTCR